MTTNGARDVVCFACRNSKRVNLHVPRGDKGGFYHQYECIKNLPMPNCKVGIEDAEIVAVCPEGKPQLGFQIGGYYSQMWFEPEASCLSWKICSDGEFPTDEPQFDFHICNFEQLEKFVKFWRSELDRHGWNK